MDYAVAVWTIQWLYGPYSHCMDYAVAVWTIQWLYGPYSHCMDYAVAVWTTQWLYGQYKHYNTKKRRERKKGREILGNITENFPRCIYVSQNVACGTETSFCKVLNRKCLMYMCTCSLHSVSRRPTYMYIQCSFTNVLIHTTHVQYSVE